MRPGRDRAWAGVADDGYGFDPELTIYRFDLAELVLSRVQALGGQVELRSAPGQGTLVRMWGPPP